MMPARDFYHDAVKNALIKDGWTITNDPYILNIGGRDLFVDLGVKRMGLLRICCDRASPRRKLFWGFIRRRCALILGLLWVRGVE